MDVDRLGKYEIRGTLGKGAMGTVYEGWDPIISRKVAIKTVRLPDAADIDAQEELARFKREAQAAGRLTHPNIVGIFDYGETDELAYIVMEFVDGHTLKSHARRAASACRWPQVGRVMADLLAGLHYSHERGVIHRDIKPANIMIVGGDAGSGQAKIADFGIARIESSNLTQAGHHHGHPGLHVARAVHGPDRGRPHRHLFRGRAAVPAADRRAAVRGQHGDDHAQGAEHGAAEAVRAVGHRAGQPRPGGRPRDGQAAGGPVPDRRRLCRGAAGGARGPEAGLRASATGSAISARMRR